MSHNSQHKKFRENRGSRVHSIVWAGLTINSQTFPFIHGLAWSWSICLDKLRPRPLLHTCHCNDEHIPVGKEQ